MGTNLPVRYYRIYVYLGQQRLYACRSTLPLPHVSWFTKDQEYPDHFTLLEMREIMHAYSDQNVKYEECYVAAED